MYFYRVSKYNPDKRNKNGDYTLEDWTSFYDIGQLFMNKKLTFQEYEKIESQYIKIVISSMVEIGQNYFVVTELEKYEYNADEIVFGPDEDSLYKDIRNNDKVFLKEIPLLMKLQLRDIIWGKLISENLIIHFGYDYYMYIISSKKLTKMTKNYQEHGIYIEEGIKSPYLIPNTDS